MCNTLTVNIHNVSTSDCNKTENNIIVKRLNAPQNVTDVKSLYEEMHDEVTTLKTIFILIILDY